MVEKEVGFFEIPKEVKSFFNNVFELYEIRERIGEFKQIKLCSFNFIAFKATGANVFGRNGSVGVFNLNFLNVGIIRTGGFAVTVANLVSRQFSFSANASLVSN